jgi:hypothetical protein
MLLEPEPVRPEVLDWRQIPETAKQPPARFQPFTDVEVALERWREAACTPPAKVEVAVVVETVSAPPRVMLPKLSRYATVVEASFTSSRRRVLLPTGYPQIVSLDAGDEVPIPRRVPSKTKVEEVAQVFAAVV